jgi:flagellin
MPQIIQTNIASLNAQRNLDRSQSALNVSLQRLSTGLRINSAKDDAAGLAISDRFTTQIRGLNQAIRNANDGISFSQTAEGALSTVGDALQRIRELAVQSINDTNSSADRQALNNEAQQLIAEVNRIANATQFNGQNILDGSLSTLTFQVGANQNQTISVTGVDSRGSQLGADIATGASVDSATLTGSSGAFTINGTTVDTSAAVTSGDVDDLITAINAVANDSGVNAQKASTLAVAFTFADADDTLTLNGVDITYTAASGDIDSLTQAINDISGQTGVTATNDGTDVTLSSANAADMVITTTSTLLDGGAIAGVTYQAGVVLSTDVGTGTADGSIILAGTDAGDFGLSEGASTADRRIVNDVDVLTPTTANDALLTLDFALQSVSGLRSELGAVQIRFESTIANLSVTVENQTAARSRIRDADFAAETAELTRTQVLQQAGLAVLAQANQLTANVLALLQ